MKLSNGDRLLCWPTAEHVITAGWTYSDWTVHHAIDLRAAVGTPVVAAESGTVDWVQTWDGRSKTGNQSYGNLVRIVHEPYEGKPLCTLYAHLSQINVKAGEKVVEGQVIGYSGQTGNVTGPHLHFEVRLSNIRVNPLTWLNSEFSTTSDTVREHLGRYTSVEVPKAETPKKLQSLCVVCASNNILRKARELGLTVEIHPCAVIGPASDGDAMTLWSMSNANGCDYYSKYEE